VFEQGCWAHTHCCVLRLAVFVKHDVADNVLKAIVTLAQKLALLSLLYKVWVLHLFGISFGVLALRAYLFLDEAILRVDLSIERISEPLVHIFCELMARLFLPLCCLLDSQERILDHVPET